MTDSAAGGIRYAARRRRRAASRVARGRENSSSRWCARKPGDEGVGAAGGAAAAVAAKDWSRNSDEGARPRRPRDMGMAGGELGVALGGAAAGGSGVDCGDGAGFGFVCGTGKKRES